MNWWKILIWRVSKLFERVFEREPMAETKTRSFVEDANKLAIEICKEVCGENWIRQKYKVEYILRGYFAELEKELETRHYHKGDL